VISPPCPAIDYCLPFNEIGHGTSIIPATKTAMTDGVAVELASGPKCR